VIALTASSAAGINNGAGFRVDDLGRAIRVLQNCWSVSGFNALTSGGAGFHVGDTITPAGGTPIVINNVPQTAQFTVTAVSGGVITGIDITNYGAYLVPPPTNVTQGATNGNGTGATGTLSYAQVGTPLWHPGTLTTIADATHATATMGTLVLDAVGTTAQAQFLSNAAIGTWRLGAWCPFQGFPGCGGLFQSRLVAGGVPGQSKRLFGSEAGGPSRFGSFAPSLATGQVIDSNAITVDLDDDQGDTTSWLSGAGSAQIPQLAVGAGDAEFILQGGAGNILTPTNLQAYRETRYGTAPIAPLRLGKYLLFPDRSLRRLRQWFYLFYAGGYVGPEAAPFGRHLLLAGIKQLAEAQTPHPTIWVLTNDGQLAGLTFVTDEKDQNNTVAAWHSHQLGGSYYGGPPIIDSFCVLPAEDGSYDRLRLCVLRTMPDRTPVRSLEYWTPYFRATTRLAPPVLDQAVFLDMAVSSALTLPNATCTLLFNPITDPQTGEMRTLPQRGDTVEVAFSVAVAAADDATIGTVLRINGGTFRTIQFINTGLIETECLDPPASLGPAFANGWSYTRRASSFTGFAALNGFTVSILADGQPYSGLVVTGGTITLPAGATPASYITAGLPYLGELETLDLDLPAIDGTSQMKEGDIDTLYVRLFDTLGGTFGLADYPSDPIEIAFDEAGWPPPLVTDDLRLPMPGGSSQHRRVRIRQTQPWPMTVSALVVKGGTQEARPK
jgi:hypothetical protein